MNELSNQFPVELKSMDKEIYVEVLKQIIKDFNLVGLSPSWKENDSAEFFWKEFLSFINHLLRHEQEKLRALLYRIDLDEANLVTLIEASSSDAITDFSRKLLIREMQKVMFRRGL